MSVQRAAKRRIQKNAGKSVQEDIKKYTDNVKEIAVKKAVESFAVASFIVLHDKFGFGESRLKKFNSEITNLFDCIVDGYVTLEELKTEVREKYNINI